MILFICTEKTLSLTREKNARKASFIWLIIYTYRYILNRITLIFFIFIIFNPPSNHHQTTFNHYWTSIEHLSNIHRTTIRPLSNIYQTTIVPLSNVYRMSIESHQTSIEHLSNHYQTFVKLLFNIFQILIVRYIIIYLSILNYRGINETYLC